MIPRIPSYPLCRSFCALLFRALRAALPENEGRMKSADPPTSLESGYKIVEAEQLSCAAILLDQPMAVSGM